MLLEKSFHSDRLLRNLTKTCSSIQPFALLLDFFEWCSWNRKRWQNPQRRHHVLYWENEDSCSRCTILLKTKWMTCSHPNSLFSLFLSANSENEIIIIIIIIINYYWTSTFSCLAEICFLSKTFFWNLLDGNLFFMWKLQL